MDPNHHCNENNYGALFKNDEINSNLDHQKNAFSFLNQIRNSVISSVTASSSIGNSSAVQAFFNLCKVFIGIGILTGPAAISRCGVVLGVFGITAAGCVSLYSINIQAQTRHKFQQLIAIHAYESGNQNETEYEREESEYRRREVDNSLFDQSNLVQSSINNYSELGKAAYGRNGYLFVSVCLFLQQMCSVTAYFSFIGNYLNIF